MDGRHKASAKRSSAPGSSSPDGAGADAGGPTSSSCDDTDYSSAAHAQSCTLYYVTKSQIRPTDVLCGRGHFKHTGNAAFLAVVGEYKDEYVASRSHKVKDGIANIIVERIWSAADPCSSGDDDGDDEQEAAALAVVPSNGGGGRVRFLQQQHHGGGGGSGNTSSTSSSADGEETTWRVLTDRSAVLEKVKMALRQKPRGKTMRKEAAAAAAAATAAAAAAGQGQSSESGQGQQSSHPDDHPSGRYSIGHLPTLHTITMPIPSSSFGQFVGAAAVVGLRAEEASPVVSAAAVRQQQQQVAEMESSVLPELAEPPEQLMDYLNSDESSNNIDNSDALLADDGVDFSDLFDMDNSADVQGGLPSSMNDMGSSSGGANMMASQAPPPRPISHPTMHTHSATLEPLHILDDSNTAAAANGRSDARESNQGLLMAAEEDPLMAKLINGLDMAAAEDCTCTDLEPIPQGPLVFHGEERPTNFDQRFLQDLAETVGASNAPVSANVEAKTDAIAKADATANINDKAHLLNNANVALGVARTLAENHRTSSGHDGKKIQSDLKNLGLVLFQFFTGVAAPTDMQGTDAAETANYCRERQLKRTEVASAQPTASDILRDAGFPNSICTLLMSLLQATDPSATERYISSADVEADLIRMVSNPDQCLFDLPSQYAGTLDFSGGKLYGRDQEYDRMKSCFDSVIVRQEERRGVVLVSGPAGSGKTSLADKLRGPLAERRGMMLSVKFDSQGSEQPISKIFRSIEEYCQRLLQGDATLLVEVGLAIRQALGPEVAVLKDLIPSLGIVIGGWGSTHFDMEQKETYNLILHCFRRVVRAISGPTHPIIWMLDDLQWSDAASLEMITNLVTDEETRSVLFIGCFRDDEVTEDYVLNRALGDITMAASYSKTISLRNLDKDSVNALLSEALHLQPRLTRPLAGLLFTKTRGNPMFVRQLLRSLCDEGLLQYSARSRRWIWDIDAISAKNVADNTVDLIINMMHTYDDAIQWVLRTASCLGSRFDAATIKLLYSVQSMSSSSGDDGSDVFGHISTIISDGLMIKKGSTYRFSHDQIWQAAYALTPSSERKAMHLFIGRQLLCSATEEKLDVFLFTIVDQLNRCIDIINDHTDQIEVAELNLKAGEKALSALSFNVASMYLLQGSILIRNEDWQSHYALLVRIFTACAEVQLAQGHNDGAKRTLEPVLANGKSLDDKLRAYHTLILAYIAESNFKDATQTSMLVLEKLGESFPDAAGQSVIRIELHKTQQLIGSRSVDDILSIHTITDARKIALLRTLIGASRAAYVANPMLMLLLVLRMVQIALVDGLTPESSYSFAALSFALSGLGNHDVSAYCANVATKLLAKFDQKYSNMVVTLLNMSILPYRQPIQACLDSFRSSFKDACSVGDRDWARISVNQIVQILITAPERGKTLDDAEIEIRQIYQGITTLQEGKNTNLVLTLMYLQMLLNLKSAPRADGYDDLTDPTTLTGEALNQDEFLKLCREEQIRDYFRQFYCCRTYLAYLFRKYDLAAEMLEECQAVAAGSRVCPSFEVIFETFYMGLTAAAMLRQGSIDAAEKSKWHALASNSMQTMRRWAEDGSEWNFRHKYDLMSAELAFTNGDGEEAMGAYGSAILGARKSGYINEEALGCERAGIFHMEQGNMAEAGAYLIRAKDLYSTWNAARKVMDVSQLLQICQQ